jgi:hypothetical protein
MRKEDIKDIIDSPLDFDDSRDESYGSMVKDIFSKPMRWVVINLYGWFFVLLIAIIYSVVQFFNTDQTQYHILYAAVFVCSWVTIGIAKIYALVILQKFKLRREVKRLELRVAELSESVKSK